LVAIENSDHSDELKMLCCCIVVFLNEICMFGGAVAELYIR
jgi:hypothetical protein